ncbi:MAG: sugar transferase [Nitrospirae bacterium]|nr:sugar transferase [Nitrospirota bacterium]
MQIRHRREVFVFAMVAMDTVLITLSYLCAYYVRANIPLFGREAGVGSANYQMIYPVLLFSWLTILSLMRQYEPRRRWGVGEIFFSVFLAVTIGTLFLLAFAYSLRYLLMSRLLLLYLWFFGGIFLVSGRLIVRILIIWLARKGVIIKKILIGGWGQAAQMLARYYRNNPEMGYEVSGFVMENEMMKQKLVAEEAKTLSHKGILGTMERICEVAEREEVFSVILTGSIPDKEKLAEILERLGAAGIKVSVVPSLFELAPRNMGFAEIGNVPVISFRELPMVGWEAIGKRILDIIGAMFGLIFLSPLFLLMAILIKRESPGPVFFGQERIGQDGKPFRMYKFRSMVASAANDPPVKVKSEEDTRVTRIGRFLRKTSIDELPQLFNVFKGNMSLVGPRPETYLYVSQYNKWNKRRLYLRPGMTGLAQSLGVRGDTSIDEKTKYDIEYMEDQSLWLDIKILFRTLWVVLSGKEAY